MCALMVLIVAPLFSVLGRTSASQLISYRTVLINTAVPGAIISETFSFSLASTAAIGSISFEHCDNSPLPQVPCNAPAGYTATSSNLSSQSNNTGFTFDPVNTTANRIVITRLPAAGVLGTTSFVFTNVHNTTASGQTVYTRVSTYASIDGTGAAIDAGSMAYATQGGFSVGAYVPPFLIFCVGITVGNHCTTSNGSLIEFGELSATQPKFATSQFSGATNDPGGYQVFVDGHTMTAGNQIIPALDSGGASTPGTGQFGFNLSINSNPSVGANQTGVGTSVVTSNYNQPNIFRMAAGDLLTNSTTSTDFNVTTVSYIVNISTSQSPGSYATTLAYIATAAF